MQLRFKMLRCSCVGFSKSKYNPIYVTLSFNHLTAAIRGSGYKVFVTLYHELAVRIEHYLQIRTVSRWPG